MSHLLHNVHRHGDCGRAHCGASRHRHLERQQRRQNAHLTAAIRMLFAAPFVIVTKNDNDDERACAAVIPVLFHVFPIPPVPMLHKYILYSINSLLIISPTLHKTFAQSFHQNIPTPSIRGHTWRGYPHPPHPRHPTPKHNFSWVWDFERLLEVTRFCSMDTSTEGWCRGEKNNLFLHAVAGRFPDPTPVYTCDLSTLLPRLASSV